MNTKLTDENTKPQWAPRFVIEDLDRSEYWDGEHFIEYIKLAKSFVSHDAALQEMESKLPIGDTFYTIKPVWQKYDT